MSQHDIPIRNTVIIHPDCRETFLGGTAGGGLGIHGFRLAGVSEFRTSYRIAREGERHHVVFATLAGRGHLRARGSDCALESGDLFVVPALTPHEYRLDAPSWSACWFHLERVPNWIDVGPLRVERGDIDAFRRLQALMEDYAAESASQAALASRAASALADLIAVHLERLIRPASPPDPVLRAVAAAWDRAARSPGRSWRISELASAAGRSDRQFHRDTVALYARTPGDHLTRLRLDRAAEYLRTTDYSLAVIAELVGFKNPYSLSNAYARVNGRRPSEDRYRR